MFVRLIAYVSAVLCLGMVMYIVCGCVYLLICECVKCVCSVIILYAYRKV